MTQNNSGELEVEVAYLPTRIPEGLDDAQAERVVDVYLSGYDSSLAKLRLRQKGDKYEFTKKVSLDPNNFSLQQEYNVPLSKEEFEKLREAGGREVVKDRYKLPLDGRVVEVDVFRDALEGFVMVEIELASEAELSSFTPPDYCGADVSQEGFVAGSYLAGKNLADIQPELDRLGYKPLTLSK